MTVSTRLFSLVALGASLVPVRAEARCQPIVVRVNGRLESPLGSRELVLQVIPDPRGKSRTTINVDGTRFSGTVQFSSAGNDGAERDCSPGPQNVSVTLVSGERRREVARLDFPRDFQSTKGTWLARSAIRVDPERDLAIP